MAGGRSTKGNGAKRASDGPPKASQSPKQWPADSIRRFKLETLLPYARNPRLHSDEQVDKLAKGIQRYGFTTPIAVDKNGELIAGHGRVLAAKKLGLDEIPGFVRPDDWTDDDVKAYRIWDNQSALLSEWDSAMLKIEVGDLKLADYSLDLLGFEKHTLDWYAGDGSIVNPLGEWFGMPEFNQEDKNAFRSIIVHFVSQEDVEAFSKLVGQKFTDKTKFMWFPEIKPETRMDKVYKQAESAE